ncbi:30S ribosomal protein S8 [Candidatus Blochmanniella vafra str. BVAF]|uniref:Small ribosomal subunit protein uS8 n=1 Tax=Blochmanniella vafra (strain BVAF) TaxID=859654 RepID=E8Q5Z1_BLOVB|nr:30S ribosomal protein S8 [Candidatus Blochmannia vafer]ADV33607.1 30S ribosomal protein S8 [Candidatus Blochmannia vafer str. BVAF]
MSTQDPISEMLTAIRNAQISKKDKVCLPSSSIKVAIIKVLTEEGFIKQYFVHDGIKPILEICLKYYQYNNPVIESIKRVSRPGLRVYRNKRKIPKVMSGMGVVIISTAKGVMTDKKAKRLNIGGEIICYVS